MSYSLFEFKNITRDFNSASRHLATGNVELACSYSWGAQPKNWSLVFTEVLFETFEDLYNYVRLTGPLTCGELTGRLKEKTKFQWLFDKIKTESKQHRKEVNNETVKEHKTIKFVPSNPVSQKQAPKVIDIAPYEITEGDYTYRILVKNATITYIARNDEPIYDYLDRSYCMMLISVKHDENSAAIKESCFPTVYPFISDVYDINTAHIFSMLRQQPTLGEMLQDGCFINQYDAELLRLRMQKKLKDQAKEAYLLASKDIDAAYQDNTTLLVVGKVMKNEAAKTVVNGITITPNSATYENVSIESEGLLNLLYSKLNFNSEFDIYGIIQLFTNHVQETVDKKKPEDSSAVDSDPDVPRKLETKVTKKDIAFPAFRINGIDCLVELGSSGGRYINGVKILKAEVSQALYRASCMHTAADYLTFLKTISRMCIRWHDVIGNGLPVKIHASLRANEASDPTPSVSAPALKFFIDTEEEVIKLQVSKERSVVVQLNKLIRKVDTINRKTNFGKTHKEGDPSWVKTTRDQNWASLQLIDALLESTYLKSKGADGVEVKTPQLTKADLEALLQLEKSNKMTALERSREFMRRAVQITGAEQVQFMGKDAYKVQGTMRTYAVIIESAKVYDFDTKQYRCIVNTNHYKGVGYDDVASRLLALKNDSVIQTEIGTLASANGQHDPGNIQGADRGETPASAVQTRINTLKDKLAVA